MLKPLCSHPHKYITGRSHIPFFFLWWRRPKWPAQRNIYTTNHVNCPCKKRVWLNVSQHKSGTSQHMHAALHGYYWLPARPVSKHKNTIYISTTHTVAVLSSALKCSLDVYQLSASQHKNNSQWYITTHALKEGALHGYYWLPARSIIKHLVISKIHTILSFVNRLAKMREVADYFNLDKPTVAYQIEC